LIARTHIDATLSQPDIWIEDLERGTVYPALKTLQPDMAPAWSRDGRKLAFVTGHLPHQQGKMTVNIVAADGTGLVRSLPCPGDYCEPTDWSAGRFVASPHRPGIRQFQCLERSTDPEGARSRYWMHAYDEMDARYSPDGRWVGYVSTEAGQPQVMVRTVSGPPRRMVVSGEGGAQPVWRRDGKMLYFVNLAGRLQSVAVHWAGNGDPTFGLPSQARLPEIGFGHWGRNTTFRPTAAACYYMQPTEELPPHEIQVAINWRSLLNSSRRLSDGTYNPSSRQTLARHHRHRRAYDCRLCSFSWGVRKRLAVSSRPHLVMEDGVHRSVKGGA
jgi:hypothetical protein